MNNRQTNYFLFLRCTGCFLEKVRRLTRFYPITNPIENFILAEYQITKLFFLINLEYVSMDLINFLLL